MSHDLLLQMAYSPSQHVAREAFCGEICPNNYYTRVKKYEVPQVAQVGCINYVIPRVFMILICIIRMIYRLCMRNST